MRKSFVLLTVCTAWLAAVAQAQSVKTDYDTKTDFKKFNTYAWLAPGDSVLNRHRRDKPFGDYVMYYGNRELKSKGMHLDTLQPDAIFVFYTSVQEITTYSQSATLSVGVGVGGPGYYMSGYAPVAGGTITATTEEDGLLKFVMYDTQSGNMVWSGMVEKKFKLTDDVTLILDEYTTRIFNKYPLKKNKAKS